MDIQLRDDINRKDMVNMLYVLVALYAWAFIIFHTPLIFSP